MFSTPAHDAHVHVRAPGDPEIDRHLAFRDHLRNSPADRNRYARLKRALAARTWTDMNHYADAKGPLIEEILAGAAATRDRPIRSAGPGDAAAITPLLGELGYPTEAAEAVTRLTDLLARDGEGALVYDLDGATVGLLTWQLMHLIYRAAPQLRITALVVRGDQRRRGIAHRAARGRRADRGAEHGCTLVDLTTRPRRADAPALYESAGFEERPRRLVKRLPDAPRRLGPELALGRRIGQREIRAPHGERRQLVLDRRRPKSRRRMRQPRTVSASAISRR